LSKPTTWNRTAPGAAWALWRSATHCQLRNWLRPTSPKVPLKGSTKAILTTGAAGSVGEHAAIQAAAQASPKARKHLAPAAQTVGFFNARIPVKKTPF
jgi:IS5 family transposase